MRGDLAGLPARPAVTGSSFVPRLLIVSPHFPPSNTPDMQRVRMSLPHFVAAGWEVTVLAVDDPQPGVPLEPELLETVPAVVRVVRTRCLRRRAGVGNIALRALPFLWREGTRLVRDWRPDLVYFSTTQFAVMPLGRVWLNRFKVPYVIDLQDPWLNDYYEQPGAPRPPGGWKYRVARLNARLLEGWTLRRCAHVISVSQGYLDSLARRYAWFTPERGSVLTFGAPEADMELARRKVGVSPPLLPAPGRRLRVAYAGRLGMDMKPALEVLFGGLAQARKEGLEIEVFFFGTSYAAAGTGESTTGALAAAAGVADLVHESSARIPYLDSLRLLLETDIALLLGSEDAAYSPSKLYPTLLAGRPTLAIAPAGGVLEKLLGEFADGCERISFAPGEEAMRTGAERVAGCLHRLAQPGVKDSGLARAGLQRHSAAAVAQAQLSVFTAAAASGQKICATARPGGARVS